MLLGITANVLAAEVPQVLLAVTVMLPEAVPTVTGILFEVDVPLQPAPGSAQVYVAPPTAVTL